MPTQYPAQVIELLRTLAKHNGPVPIATPDPDAVAIAQDDGLILVAHHRILDIDTRTDGPGGKPMMLMLKPAGRKALLQTETKGNDEITLDPEDVAILKTLADAGTTLTQEKIGGKFESSFDGKTVSKRLKRLRKHGLTHRPNGPRGGEAITEAGRSLLSRLTAAD